MYRKLKLLISARLIAALLSFIGGSAASKIERILGSKNVTQESLGPGPKNVPSAEGGWDLGKCVVSLKADPGDGPRHAYSRSAAGIFIYRFDRAKYALEPVGDAVKCFAPLCFKFMRVPPFPATNLL